MQHALSSFQPAGAVTRRSPVSFNWTARFGRADVRVAPGPWRQPPRSATRHRAPVSGGGLTRHPGGAPRRRREALEATR